MTSIKAPRSVPVESLPQRGSRWRFEDGRIGIVASSQRSAGSGGVVVYVGPETFTVAAWDAELVFGRATCLDAPASDHEVPAQPTDSPPAEALAPMWSATRHRADPADVLRPLCGGTNRGDVIAQNGAVDCPACLAVMAAPSPEPDASRLSVAERRDPTSDELTAENSSKVDDATAAQIAEVRESANRAATQAVARAEDDKGAGRSGRGRKRERKA